MRWKRRSTTVATLRSFARMARSTEGYIFDRKTGKTLDDSSVRFFPKDSPEKRSLKYSEIAGLRFTGKDRAAGASWEAWVKKWNEKKAAGEKGFGLHPESLD